MAEFIASGNIEVFPNAQRAAANPNYLKARKMTEENTVGLLKHTVDKDSYVITEAGAFSYPLEFVIGGYYVKVITGPLPVFEDSDHNRLPLYAHINVVSGVSYTELIGQDAGDPSKYNGVAFSPDDNEPGYNCHLLLLDSNGEIPETSRVMIYPDRLDISKIAYIGGIAVS